MTMVPSKYLYLIPIIIILITLIMLGYGLSREIYLLRHDLLEITIDEEYYTAVKHDQELVFLSKDENITYSDTDDRRGNILIYFDINGNTETFVFRIDEMEDKYERYEITMMNEEDYSIGEYHALFKVKFLDNNDYEFYTRVSETYLEPSLVIDNTNKTEEIQNIVIYILVSSTIIAIAVYIKNKIRNIRIKRTEYLQYGSLKEYTNQNQEG